METESLLQLRTTPSLSTMDAASAQFGDEAFASDDAGDMDVRATNVPLLESEHSSSPSTMRSSTSGHPVERHPPNYGADSDLRFARKELLSRYIPETDPENKRARTRRVVMARRSTVLALQLGVAITVVLINFGVAVWAVLQHPPIGGIGTLYVGDCSYTGRLNTLLHVVLNIISTAFLGAGNYCMQLLAAPSATEVSRSHKKDQSLEIGVQSVKNIARGKRIARVLWISLGTVATVLHLL